VPSSVRGPRRRGRHCPLDCLRASSRSKLRPWSVIPPAMMCEGMWAAADSCAVMGSGSTLVPLGWCFCCCSGLECPARESGSGVPPPFVSCAAQPPRAAPPRLNQRPPSGAGSQCSPREHVRGPQPQLPEPRCGALARARSPRCGRPGADKPARVASPVGVRSACRAPV